MTYRNNAILTPQRTYLTWFQSDFTLKIFEISFRLFAMSVLLGDLLVTIPKNGRLILRCAKKWNIKICCTSDLYPYDGFYVGNDPKMSEHVRLVCFFLQFFADAFKSRLTTNLSRGEIRDNEFEGVYWIDNSHHVQKCSSMAPQELYMVWHLVLSAFSWNSSDSVQRTTPIVP